MCGRLEMLCSITGSVFVRGEAEAGLCQTPSPTHPITVLNPTQALKRVQKSPLIAVGTSHPTLLPHSQAQSGSLAPFPSPEQPLGAGGAKDLPAHGTRLPSLQLRAA